MVKLINFEKLDDVACLKDSEAVIQKAKDILAFISGKGGESKIHEYTLVLKDNELNFCLEVKIPMQNEQSLNQS